MVKPRREQETPQETALMRSLEGFFDPEWYQAHYPDLARSDLHPLLHFIRHGIVERRDPNPFFDSAWYIEHYPDVNASGLHPLVHYLHSGAEELRNPHPHFDALWYVDQHPDAAANPLLYHIRTGLAEGYATEQFIDIRDYLPSQRKPFPLPRKLIVDVVIPVYRGLVETQRCIASVLASKGRPLGRIIVVDDRSPERELRTWLQQLDDKRQIYLLRNKLNVGFVVSANRGMEAAGTHDVVLLNSDAEVPHGWLGRLAAQAYAKPRIATVSPLSNNATICGYPANEGGPLALGLTTAQIDNTCRTVNAGRWVDVPTTVGFCMYIRREALQEVGTFDAERFTIGYGEENDFCLRASDRGWQHRLACDTFVYHKGSVSFGSKANRLAERALELIAERYPDYQRDVARYVGLGAVAPFRFAITASLFRQSELPVVLLIAHGLGGGVHRHITDLVERLQDQVHFLLLEASDRGAALSVPSLLNHPVLSLPAERIDDMVLMLQSMNVSRAHIHHLLGVDMDIRALIHRLEVPFDLTVHDYYGICPQINLLPWRHALYCGEPDVAGCNACIAQRSSHAARDIVTWRAEQAWQFKDAARVFCPSLDLLSRLQRYGLAANAVFAPHEVVEAGPWPQRVVPLGSGKMRIAVLGTLVDHKGGRTVASVAEMIDPATTELHLIGHIDGPFSSPALERIKVTGQYAEADLMGLIRSISPHLIWFPAAWPETYSYTLSTAINAGIPIAATEIGAHTERLAGRPLTWLADAATSPIAWIRIFDEIRTALAADYAGETRWRSTPPIREAVDDYYATNYLGPLRRSYPIRTRNRQSTSRIAIVPERFDVGIPTPCAYIRLLQPLHHPAVAGDRDIRIATIESIFDHEAEIIVTQRFALPDVETAERLAAHARRVGATLVFDLDDDLLNIPRNHPDAEVLRPCAKVARRTLDLADVVWLSSPGLAKRLSLIRPDAVVIENGLDERIWITPTMPCHDQHVRILCMGTTTHDRDFEMIEPALSRLKAEYGDRIDIDIIGMTNRDDLPVGLNQIGLPPEAMRSYPGFVNWLRSAEPAWHIGLAPLLDTPFNACKSPIKAMDYAAMGLVVLASDTPVYRGSIADGPAGQLVPNKPGAWYAALNRLLRDPEARRTISSRSRNVFLAKASLASQAEVRHVALSRLLETRNNNAAA